METVKVEHLGKVDYTNIRVPMALIYKDLPETPGKYVIRLIDGANNMFTGFEVHCDTLNDARKAIIQSQRMEVGFPPFEQDVPELVEWRIG